MNTFVIIITIFTTILFGLLVRNSMFDKLDYFDNSKSIRAPKSYRIVSVILIFCHMFTSVLLIFFSSNSVEDIRFVAIYILFPIFAGVVLLSLWFNLKRVVFSEDLLVFYNMFGVKRTYYINNLSFSVGRERIKIYTEDKYVFSINYLWNNNQLLINTIPNTKM